MVNILASNSARIELVTYLSVHLFVDFLFSLSMRAAFVVQSSGFVVAAHSRTVTVAV